MPTLTRVREFKQAERVVDNIEDLEEVKIAVETGSATDEAHPETLERIKRVLERVLEELPDIRVSVAAELLELSEPTVRKWTEVGLLKAVSGASHMRVTTCSVRAVRQQVLTLRRLGKKRNLLEAVLARIEDEELLAEVRESIAAMQRGELKDITPAN